MWTRRASGEVLQAVALICFRNRRSTFKESSTSKSLARRNLRRKPSDSVAAAGSSPLRSALRRSLRTKPPSCSASSGSSLSCGPLMSPPAPVTEEVQGGSGWRERERRSLTAGGREFVCTSVCSLVKTKTARFAIRVRTVGALRVFRDVGSCRRSSQLYRTCGSDLV